MALLSTICVMGWNDIECVLYRQKMFSMIEGLLNPLSWGAGGAAR